MNKKLPLLLLIGVFNLFMVFSQSCVTQLNANYYTANAQFANGNTYIWGDNSYGQIGNGTTTNQYTKMILPDASNWTTIVHGDRFTLGIKQDGTLWSWGNNSTGQLGLGDTITEALYPTQVGTDTDWATVAAGVFHALAIKQDGTLWGWGSNNSFALTDQFSINEWVPVQISTDTDWTHIAVTGWSSFAIKQNGTLWAWGSNHKGELGTNSTNQYQHTITQVGTDNNWESVKASSRHVAALKTNHTLWGWGENNSGQVGDGTNTNKHAPTQIGTDHYSYYSVGDYVTCGIKEDGTLWLWGALMFQASSFIPQSQTPIQIGTDTDWSTAEATISAIFALKTDQSLWVGGYNYSGIFGDNSPFDYGSNLYESSTCTPLALTPFDKNAIKIYPNPVNDVLHIENNTNISKYEIVNLLGQTIRSSKVATKNFTIETKSFPTGTYLLTIYSSDGSHATRKIVKK